MHRREFLAALGLCSSVAVPESSALCVTTGSHILVEKLNEIKLYLESRRAKIRVFGPNGFKADLPVYHLTKRYGILLAVSCKAEKDMLIHSQQLIKPDGSKGELVSYETYTVTLKVGVAIRMKWSVQKGKLC